MRINSIDVAEDITAAPNGDMCDMGPSELGNSCTVVEQSLNLFAEIPHRGNPAVGLQVLAAGTSSVSDIEICEYSRRDDSKPEVGLFGGLIDSWSDSVPLGFDSLRMAREISDSASVHPKVVDQAFPLGVHVEEGSCMEIIKLPDHIGGNQKRTENSISVNLAPHFVAAEDNSPGKQNRELGRFGMKKGFLGSSRRASPSVHQIISNLAHSKQAYEQDWAKESKEEGAFEVVRVGRQDDFLDPNFDWAYPSLIRPCLRNMPKELACSNSQYVELVKAKHTEGSKQKIRDRTIEKVASKEKRSQRLSRWLVAYLRAEARGVRVV